MLISLNFLPAGFKFYQHNFDFYQSLKNNTPLFFQSKYACPIIIIIIIVRDRYSNIEVMITTAIKKVVGMQKNQNIIPLKHHLLPSCSFLLFKGYEPHFQWFDLHHKKYDKNAKFYCYDRAVVDISLQMAIRGTRTLTYVSSRNYETVVAISKTLNNEQKHLSQTISNNNISDLPNLSLSSSSKNNKKARVISKPLTSDISQIALTILKHCNFIIKTASVDIHPFECYYKMCGYLQTTRNANILQAFQCFGCSDKMLFDCFTLVPFLSKIRDKFLVTDELKLKTLQRRPEVKVTLQMVKEYVAQWSKIIDIKIAQSAYSSFDEQAKLNWVIENNLGQIISKEDLIKGRHRRYFYATWN